ncbi:hypothetical protein BSP109_01635 [Brevibacterium sp. Mu109]|uniref:hypothetical protein n=1 Tax=Brevibacterium sp. Mu109 TaxID=1255669 RepID=UPI000C4306A4|nr:hypothetical protein [Brevibacterium sp. Mu109]SMX80675.1 hypothetical protein BSP109_01635 [Brevibacterium sp. Mu109]
MTDERLIGEVLALQSKRLTELRNLVDKLEAQANANGDTLERIHRTLNDGGAK